MDAIDQTKLIKAVESTGYDLENYVYEVLKGKGWQVISNRYYIDDSKGIEREIDLLAYKTKTDSNHVVYYTVLLISCKKTANSCWTFLTRQRPSQDPNTEYFLVENHTTDKILKFMLKYKKESIKEQIEGCSKIRTLFEVDHLPFAFQQINCSSYKKEDDTKIYDSIITSIKALEYEKDNRGRPEIDSIESYFYNYNLLSVYEGDMFEVFFDNNSKDVKEISQIKYINRHIVGKREAYYKVHFIKKDVLDTQLDVYDELHLFNRATYPQLISDYYRDVFLDRARANLLWKDFCQETLWSFNYFLRYELKFKTQNQTDDFAYEYKGKTLLISFNGYDEIALPDDLEKINASIAIKTVISDALLKIYRYKGLFAIDNEYLPF